MSENERLKAEGAALNKPATDELKQAVAETAAKSVSGLDKEDFIRSIMDITAATPADIMDTLFMKIVDGALFKPKYNFVLTNMLPKILVTLRNLEYKYHELEGSSDDLAIDADNTMDDFNGDYIAELAEVYELLIAFHKKIQVPEMVLSNAWVAAANMVEFVQIQIEEMVYAIDRRWENLAWTSVFAEATTIELEGAEAIDHVKALQSQIEEYKTTSQEHAGVGVDGVVTVSTVKGDVTINPDQFFNPDEFVVVVDKDQYVDTTFENEAQWYNYAATNITGIDIKVLSFSKYSGFKAIAKQGGVGNIAPEVTVPEGLKYVVMHKQALQLLMQYDYRETLKGRGPWTIQHTHMNIGSYKVKTLPILVFTKTAVKKA